MSAVATAPIISRLSDDKLDSALRPKLLSDFVGQTKVVENLRLYIDAANQRGTQLDHVLISGPPGLGKTTLASLMANELNSTCSQTTGPALKDSVQLRRLMSNVKFRQVVFVDEIHRLPTQVCEVLYNCLEDYSIMIKGYARDRQEPIQKFTCVGATTSPGRLPAPLRDRFGIQLELELYAEKHLSSIVERSAGLLGTSVIENAADEIARRSRGTPRIANRLLRRARDFAQVYNHGVIDNAAVSEIMGLMGIDRLGLDDSDRRLLQLLLNQDRPVGVEAIAASLGVDRGTIEDVNEPWLLKQGLIERTRSGRIATDRAKDWVNAPSAKADGFSATRFRQYAHTGESFQRHGATVCTRSQYW